MNNIEILIVEDEVIVAADIASRLEQKGYVIAATATSGKEALEILQSRKIDLCLLDIRLNGPMDGIELAGRIRESTPLPVIFLTSMNNDDTFERARATHPAAYMLKPFNDRELQIAIDLAIYNYSSGKSALTISDEPPVVKEHDIFQLKESIFLRKKERFERVDFKDILYAEAESNYTTIVTSAGQFVLSVTLQEVEKHLSPAFFVRIHRSYVINMQHISSIEGNMLYINNRSFQVSKSKREEVFQRFKIV
jgi:DNA-binding LytR/AlgR family response regulator